MFTLEKIAEANSKVKSGADFPRLVQEMIEMGIVAMMFMSATVTPNILEKRVKKSFRMRYMRRSMFQTKAFLKNLHDV